jgi:DNA-binding SARP family transcriptional activator
MAVRKLLAEAGRRDDLRTHPGFGYELRVAEDDVDVLLFQRLLRNADAAAADGCVEAEIDCLRWALRLWRGPHPLSNVRSDALSRDIAALEQRHKRIAVRLFELELGRGNPEGILDELTQIAAHYPADRRLCEQLMTARYRCGHVTDATKAYERYVEALDAETGAPPDPLLRSFHFAIALGEEAAITAAESALSRRAKGRARQVVPVPRQLPRPADLIGRDDAVAETVRLLRGEPIPAIPIVVISGPGGVGKTALAVRASHESIERFPDGQLFMELHGSSDSPVEAFEVLGQFLRALGALQIPDARAERMAAYRTLLADRRVLIVLDDAAGGAQVTDLIPGNPRCAVLVTSRRRLPELAGARHVTPLAPLPQADATELFLHVIRNAGLSLERDPAVERLVALCGGLPLALRIAAILRVHDHPRPTAELATRLARLGPRALEYEQMSVAGTIGAGLERLDARARRLFLALGLVRLPRFGLWAAAALLGSEPPRASGTRQGEDAEHDGSTEHRGATDAVAALSQLAASFMIDLVQSDTRYRFHDLTWEYARRRALSENISDGEAIPGLVYRALLTLARRAHARLYGGDFEVVHGAVPDWDAPAEALAEVDAAPLEWFERERLNIRAAVEHCAELGLTQTCWDLAVSAHEFYTIRGYFDDWFATHQVALRACRAAGDPRGEGIVLACLNQPTLVASRRATGSQSRYWIGQACLAADDLNGARAAFDAVSDVYGDDVGVGQAYALHGLGDLALRRGALVVAGRYLSVAAELARDGADAVLEGRVSLSAAALRQAQGHHGERIAALRHAVTVFAGCGAAYLEVRALGQLAEIARETDDAAAASAAWTRIDGLYRAAGLPDEDRLQRGPAYSGRDAVA